MTNLRFDNCFTRELPGDPVEAVYPRQVEHACFSRVRPTPVANPRLVAWSSELAAELGITPAQSPSEELLAVMAGNRLLDGMDPFAMCYGGHQFGNWAGQLGDGRAVNLGELITPGGERQTLQLKGAGLTPYSRGADGLAVLRSSLREFLCSEAMHHLGVPTTRALALVTTGEQVVRDLLYDGNPRPEPGAVVCRVAPSFIRFGNFELPAARRDGELLEKLLDHTIEQHFGRPPKDRGKRDLRLHWFTEVAAGTALMLVHWMRVGFVHGVMNTDNMSVLGLTIDYGPYGWMEGYDPDWTPNTTDAEGRRYRYGQQPAIAQWNLMQLARAILPLIGDAAPLEAVLSDFARHYQQGWREMMAAKLGLDAFRDNRSLFDELHALFRLQETDMTIFYRQLYRLAQLPPEAEDAELLRLLRPALYQPEALDEDADYRAAAVNWVRKWRRRLQADGPAGVENMNRVNPKYVPRNYLAQMAIDEAGEKGDFSLLTELLDTLRHPYDEQPEREKFAARRPEWARHRPGCSMLSCSS